MVIDPKDAQIFIAGYKDLLTEVHRLAGGAPRMKLMEMLATARDAAVAEPTLIEAAASNLEAEGRRLPEDVLEAILSLKLRRWVFLRDTTKYSVFIDVDGKEAYAVLGLTERLRDIVGGTGVLLQTGVFPFQGAYVCDGIISGAVWLGANYKKEYSDILASLKKSGHFYHA
jgi:hypothetical protein